MSITRKSKASSGRTKGKTPALDRPFAPDILARARELAGRYQVIVRRAEDGDWYGRGLELPVAMGDWTTPEACIARTREAFVAVVGYLLETGRTPPPPSEEGARTEQVNVRLSAEEKLRLE